MILIVGAGYLIFQNQQLIGKLAKSQVTPSPSLSSVPSQSSQSPQPSSSSLPKLTIKEVQQNIIAAVNSKNYAALATFMKTPKVNFLLMSTECCESKTPDEAAEQMEYIAGSEPFDFSQQNPIIVNLKDKNSQLAGTFMGISKNGEQLVAFTIDASNKISAIQLSISYKLYSQ